MMRRAAVAIAAWLVLAPPGPAGAAELVRHTVLADGHPLAVWEKSAAGAAEAVLLVHGRTWSALPDFDLQVEGEDLSFMEGLAGEGYAVFAVDLRGYGETLRDDSGWLTPNRAADDVAIVLEWMSAMRDWRRKPHLFGWSMGSTIAQLAVQRHPGLVSSLTLFGYWRDVDAELPADEPGIEPIREGNTAQAAASDFITPGSISQAAIDAYVAAALTADPVKVDLRALDQYNALDESLIEVPTLVIAGENDPLAPPERLSRLFASIATGHKQYVSVPGGDHAAFLETPRPYFLHEVVAFMRGVGLAPRRSTREIADVLDRDTADRRKARISNVEYDLFVDIASSPDDFSGHVTLRFDLADASSPLGIDFTGGTVASIEVNGAAVEADYNGYFITIPEGDLRPGATEIRIAFTHPFSRDGNGLHRFVDPEDGLAYLYTYLWPYFANRLLPSFDQPNLKARFSLRVLAPDGWTVISAAPGAPAPAEDGSALWTFATTPKIATYMFSLHAGPYRVWQSAAGDVPMRLLARRSLADCVAVDEWFETTRRGIEFYSRYFDIAYPFEKYDQLIAPETTIGGMENAAAVTFGEQFVQRRESDRGQRENRAGVILHELAHMWFGDLVTHDWWNGMWLNESFATQMAALAQTEVTELADTWHGFFVNGKKSAYRRDSRVTTHPIEMPINGTDEFHTVWDAITYQKGASVLKQLQHFVGGESYRRGVSAYLKENAWDNTELSDFIGHQEKSAGRSLDEWTAEWLLQPGFNTLAAEPECDGGVLRSLAITQSATAEHPTLRTHSIDVALYDDDSKGALVAVDVLPVIIDGARTAVAVPEGRPCPVIVNPNFKDWAYAPIAPGDGDAEVLRERLGDIEDPLSRSIFLSALYDKAMAGDMPLADYVDRALTLADGEQNIRVLEQITSSIVEAVELMQRLRPDTDAALARRLGEIEGLALRRANLAETRDLKHLWLNMFLGVVSTRAGLGTARALLDGKAEVAGVDIAPEIRWRLLTLLSRHGVAGVAGLLEQERERDPSDFGTKSLLSARAAMPVESVKAGWLAELHDPESVSGLAGQRAVMAELFPANQTDLQLRFLDDILSALPELSGHRDSYFLSRYTEQLLRPMCRPESVTSMQTALDKYADQLDATTSRFLREAHQADAECLSLRVAQH